MRNSQIAAAVAAALALTGAGAAMAAGFTAGSAVAAGTTKIYISGSSAAANGVLSAFIEKTVCDGVNFTEWDTDTGTPGFPDFRVVTCVPRAVLPAVQTTFYYRPEGGSVVGVYPVINNVAISQIDLTAFHAGYPNNAGFMCPQNAGLAVGKLTCNTGNTFIQQTSNSAGASDGWNAAPSFGGTITHVSDVGVSDVEPGAFGDAASTTAGPGNGNNDPVNYQGTVVYTFVGASRTTDDLTNAALLPAARLFQQTFGFIVNSNLGISDLPKDSIAAIFGGDTSIQVAGVPNWSLVNTASGARVTGGSTPIIVCNREVGSGSRAATDLFLTEDGCDTGGAQSPLFDYAINLTPGEPANNFATSLELDCVNSHLNSIGYVSVDNFTKLGAGKQFPATNALTVSGITASNFNSAVGVYQDNYEAWITQNTAGASASGKTFYTNAIPVLQNVNSTTQSLQITAIPNLVAANTIAYPPTAVGATPIYTSDYTRGGNSCSLPVKQK